MLSTETPTNITKLPRTPTSPLYRDYKYAIEPVGDRWRVTVIAPGGMEIHPGIRPRTYASAVEVARETIGRCVDPESMPGCVAMHDAIAEGRIG